MSRITLTLVSAACLFAQSFPGAMVKEVIPVRVEVPVRPLMQLGCDKRMRAEITESCRMRSKAI